MTRLADPARHLSCGLVSLSIAALAAITFVSPGATRMYAWPSSLAYAAVCLAPVLLLLLRAFNSRRPLVLPARLWRTAAQLSAAVVLIAALLSPWRSVSLLWSVPLLAGHALFLITFDWLNYEPDAAPARRRQLLTAAGFFFAALALVSVAFWAARLPGYSRAEIFAARNPFPLGHSNYTAGLALLMLPVFGALGVSARGWRRAGWSLAAFVALGLLFTTGSRGGLLGLVVLALAHIPALARALRLRLWLIALVTGIVLAALFYFHPRTRSLVTAARAPAALRESDAQRSAMATAALALVNERPAFGWGPGTTPLSYPRVRHLLDGGVENVLQLHSTPLHLLAEFGSFGLFAALLFAWLALRAAWLTPAVRPVFIGLLGYAAFSLTDWQLDVPVFTCACALAAALLAPTTNAARLAPLAPTPAPGNRLGWLVLALIALIAAIARPDPAPALNVRALSLARDPAQADAAIALLRQSLALNRSQEIAHFNLGWLLVTRDPAAAEHHFLAAAHLVPDKGGVYFGLALAHLNQAHRPAATRALALECLNDPLFLTSPWWRLPALAELRADAFALATTLLEPLAAARAPFSPDARYVIALIAWLDDRGIPGEILAAAVTSERVGYFARRPTRPDFAASEIRAYRRERTGYPVLMRNLDLPVPTDLFDVQENLIAANEFTFLFPRKGWLPAPVLPPLLPPPAAAPKS